MEKVNRYIYETTVNKQIEEKVIEKRVEGGETVEVTRTVKKVKPVKIAVLRPDRKRSKEAEIFYAKRLSAYLREGLLPHSLVSKRYLNDGGPLSEEEKVFVDKQKKQYIALQEEYFGMKSPLNDEQNKRRSEIIIELDDINRALRDIQANYSEIFSNTAEAKGRADVLEWWILYLSYANLDDKGYAPFYGEGDFDSRMAKLEELESKNDPFINEVIKKLSYFVSFWNTAGDVITDEDFSTAEKNYEQNVTRYYVEEEKPEQVVEPKAESKAEPAKTEVTPTPAVVEAAPQAEPAKVE
jgi:hypothetical protein